jgi:hypothetical protein
MKTKTFTSVMILALVTGYINVSATVWRVNPTPNSSAHYSTLQAAHDAASTLNNDTLYLEGSTFSAGGLTISKKLTIIGNGYFLAQNPQTQYNISPSIIGYYVYCYVGSEGSKFIGCTFNYSIYLYTNNITIERNYFSYGVNNAIYPQTSCSDILILNNYFDNYYGYQSISFNSTHSNILIANNYFNGYVSVGANFSGIFANNIFNYITTIYNSTLVNNIALYTVTLTNCVSTYNIGNSTQFGNLDGNQQNVSQSALFVGPTGTSTDGQWVLKVGSPAIGAGEEGTDIGMFGGEYPYVLSGLPPIPAIYSLDAQSLPSNTLDVNLKAKSHN